MIDPIDALTPASAAPVYPPVDAGDRGRRYYSDVRFPARKNQILASAIEHGAPRVMVDAIGLWPDGAWFLHPNDVPDLHEEARRLAEGAGRAPPTGGR